MTKMGNWKSVSGKPDRDPRCLGGLVRVASQARHHQADRALGALRTRRPPLAADAGMGGGMKERPILFNGPMVRAILAGTKTQTRRIVKPQPAWVYADMIPLRTPDADPSGAIKCPYGQPGDRLWVRETWASVPSSAYRCSEGIQQTINPCDRSQAAVYAASWDRSCPGRWRPSIYMPRWASRITLEIVSVRCERLRDITENDATAEGVTLGAFSGGDNRDATRALIALWESIHGPGSWKANLWVWVIVFKLVTD